MRFSIRGTLIATVFLAACGANPTEVSADQDDAAAAADASLPAEDTASAETSAPETSAGLDDNAPLSAAPPPESFLPEPDENGITTINWDDLLPEGEMERIEELYRASAILSEMNHFGGQMTQIGTFNVEQGLIGRTVRMPGYILPLDYQPGGEIREFLLVPYFGACIHTPPPPPNQIIYVTSAEPVQIERLWAAVWVTGELSADRHMNDLGDAAYTLDLISHEPYQR